MTTAQPFEIADNHSGGKAASNGEQHIVLLDSDGRLFRRRAVKGLGSASPQVVEWIVAELNGVRVYFDGQRVTVTRADLIP